MIRLRNLSLLALALCLVRGKWMKRVCLIALLLGLVFIGRSFAGITTFDNVEVESDTTSLVSYIVFWESFDETDTDYNDGGPTTESTREVAGWLVVMYNTADAVYDIGWLTPGALPGGGAGVDYDRNTGELLVPIHHNSPKSLLNDSR